MASGITAGRLLALAACSALAGTPFACGGDAFTAGSGDGGPTVEGSVDGAGDGPVDGTADAPGDGLTTGDSVPPAEAGAPVHGTVVDQFLQPMGGVDVHSQLQKVTTASDGTFTLPDITTPYITTVVTTAAGGHKHGYVFEGVSRRSVTLQLAAEQSSPAETAGLTGVMSTSGTSAGGIVFADFPAGTPAAASPTIRIALGATTYDGNLSWLGSSTASPTLYVLQWLTTSGVPSGYIAYTSEVQTLTGGMGQVWSPPVSVSLGQAQLQLNLGLAPGYVAASAAVYLRPHNAHVAAPIQVDTKALTSLELFTTPDIPNATFVACGIQVPAGSDGGTTRAFGAACLTKLAKDATPSIPLPAGTTFVSPPTMAGIGTTFSWQPLIGGVYLVVFAPVGTAGTMGDTLFVVTSDTQQKIPDLSGLGFAVPKGAVYVAEVYGFSPFSSIDSALSPTGYAEYLTDFALGMGPTFDGALAHSDYAAFLVQ